MLRKNAFVLIFTDYLLNCDFVRNKKGTMNVVVFVCEDSFTNTSRRLINTNITFYYFFHSQFRKRKQLTSRNQVKAAVNELIVL